jgi:hypothetical protein
VPAFVAVVACVGFGVTSGWFGSDTSGVNYLIVVAGVVSALGGVVLVLPNWGGKLYGRILAYWLGRHATNKTVWTQYQQSIKGDRGSDRWDAIRNVIKACG